MRATSLETSSPSFLTSRSIRSTKVFAALGFGESLALHAAHVEDEHCRRGSSPSSKKTIGRLSLVENGKADTGRPNRSPEASSPRPAPYRPDFGPETKGADGSCAGLEPTAAAAMAAGFAQDRRVPRDHW
jgi:hypothetical protein